MNYPFLNFPLNYQNNNEKEIKKTEMSGLINYMQEGQFNVPQMYSPGLMGQPNMLFNNNVFNLNVPFNNCDMLYGYPSNPMYGNLNMLSTLLMQLQGHMNPSRRGSESSTSAAGGTQTSQNIIKIELPETEFLNKKREQEGEDTNKKQAIKNNKFVYVLSKNSSSRRRDRENDYKKLISNHKSKNSLPPERTGKRGSMYRGVSRNGNQWQVLIMVKKRKRYVGSYSNEIEAAKNYDKVAIQHHGNKAKTNYFYTEEEIQRIKAEPFLLQVDDEY